MDLRLLEARTLQAVPMTVRLGLCKAYGLTYVNTKILEILVYAGAITVRWSCGLVHLVAMRLRLKSANSYPSGLDV
jgi:hypothetical protein